MRWRRCLWLIGVAAMLAGTMPARDAVAQADINDLLVMPRAAERNDFDSVLAMLQRGDSPDTEGEDRRAALSYAVANDNAQIVTLLLDHLANVDHRDRFGETAMHWAAINGHADMVKRLIEAHATVDPQNNEGITPLMFAITNNRRDVVRVLLAAGADVKLEDYTGHDALSWARDRPTILPLLQRAAH